MTPRDRVQYAFYHDETDRRPMQISFTHESADRLRVEMQTQDRSMHYLRGGGHICDLVRTLDWDGKPTTVG